MATKIDIISGFLGAGKTTLIKKLLKEAYADEQVVLIENEFGEISTTCCPLNASCNSFLIRVVLPAPKKPEIISIFTIITSTSPLSISSIHRTTFCPDYTT